MREYGTREGLEDAWVTENVEGGGSSGLGRVGLPPSSTQLLAGGGTGRGDVRGSGKGGGVQLGEVEGEGLGGDVLLGFFRRLLMLRQALCFLIDRGLFVFSLYA